MKSSPTLRLLFFETTAAENRQRSPREINAENNALACDRSARGHEVLVVQTLAKVAGKLLPQLRELLVSEPACDLALQDLPVKDDV